MLSRSHILSIVILCFLRSIYVYFLIWFRLMIGNIWQRRRPPLTLTILRIAWRFLSSQIGFAKSRECPVLSFSYSPFPGQTKYIFLDPCISLFPIYIWPHYWIVVPFMHLFSLYLWILIINRPVPITLINGHLYFYFISAMHNPTHMFT